MIDFYSRLCNFENLYKAHLKARKGKRHTKEVIDFELNLSTNLIEIADQLKNQTYRIQGYYQFNVYEPKKRTISALHYQDRVVQHCLCDEILEPILDRKLIYDNAACRKRKGTQFACNRVTEFLHRFIKENRYPGYFLRFDIRKFFDSIDHEVLKAKLKKIIFDPRLLNFLYMIIDSYHTEPGKGLPMGNQTSQWFAIYYLDRFDRKIKEEQRMKYYVRYMDDGLIMHPNPYILYDLKIELELFLQKEKLEFNQKTQVFTMNNGVNFLGWHFYITPKGKVIKKIKRKSIKNMVRFLKYMQRTRPVPFKKYQQVMSSYRAHFKHGNTYKLFASLIQKYRIDLKDQNKQNNSQILPKTQGYCDPNLNYRGEQYKYIDLDYELYFNELINKNYEPEEIERLKKEYEKENKHDPKRE